MLQNWIQTINNAQYATLKMDGVRIRQLNNANAVAEISWMQSMEHANNVQICCQIVHSVTM